MGYIGDIELERRQLLALSGLGLFTAACGGSGGGSGGAETLEITAATYIPPSYNDLYQAFTLFMDTATEASDGNLTFDWYDSGTLLAADQLVSGLTQGVSDVIITTSSYISSTYPILGAYELPFLLASFEQQREALAVDGEMFAFINEQLRQQNLLTLGTMPTSFEWIWTVDEPVTKPEDLAGLRIRVAGIIEGRTVEALGASPVTMSSAEVYEALERGTIDGLLSYIGTIPGRSLQEVVKYGTRGNFGDYSVDPYVRADWFDGLPQQSQEALLEAGRVYAEEGTTAMRQVHEQEYLTLIEEAGVEVVELDEAQTEAFREAVQPSYEEWRSSVGDNAIADQALEIMRS